MKAFFKNKKVIITLGVVLTVAVVAGVTFAAFPTAAETVYLKVYSKTQKDGEKPLLTAEQRKEINENHLITDDTAEDDFSDVEEMNRKWDAIYQNELDTLEILEKEYGSIENWAPESEYDLRLERTIPRVLNLLESNKLSTEDRDTLKQFLQVLRDEGKLSDDVKF